MWYNSIIYVWCEYVCIMYGCMISYVYEYGCIYGCMSMYVVCMLYVYGILALYVMRVQCAWYDMMISDWYIHVWYDLVLYVRYDLRTDAVRYIIYTIYGFWACCTTGILYVVLNTTCNCIRYYVMWILVLYYVVMCVYVDNCVDNFNFNVDNSSIYVDNFLLHLQHFYELFWKYCIFVCFRTLSLVISYLLLFSHFFIIS